MDDYRRSTTTVQIRCAQAMIPKRSMYLSQNILGSVNSTADPSGWLEHPWTWSHVQLGIPGECPPRGKYPGPIVNHVQHPTHSQHTLVSFISSAPRLKTYNRGNVHQSRLDLRRDSPSSMGYFSRSERMVCGHDAALSPDGRPQRFFFSSLLWRHLCGLPGLSTHPSSMANTSQHREHVSIGIISSH